MSAKVQYVGELGAAVPVFQMAMKTKTTPKIVAFFNNAKKFLIEGREFEKFILKLPPKPIENDHVLTSPFRSFWVEFLKFPEFWRAPAQCSDGEDMMHLFGVGVDLDQERVYVAQAKGDLARLILVDMPLERGPVHDSDVGVYAILNALIVYLQGTHVEAEIKTARIGYKRKHGRLVPKTTPYAVLYLKQPAAPKPSESSGSCEIAWQHRWKVRGHWRRVVGMGKDPEGQSIKGYTWVRECVKGPEGKPLLDRPTIALNRLPGGYKEVAKERVNEN